MVTELWTPRGVTSDLAAPFIGRNVETGGGIVMHVFHFHDKTSGRRSRCIIPKDEQMSHAEVEDMAARAYERWLDEINTDGRKRAPTAEEKKEIGRSIEQFRVYAARRRESTNNKLYYQGAKL